MARKNVTTARSAALDHKTLAAGLGKLKGPGRNRLVGSDGKTLAYLKKYMVTVPAALVARAPKRLGSFTLESNGRWAGVACADTLAARRVLEYVVCQKEEK